MERHWCILKCWIKLHLKIFLPPMSLLIFPCRNYLARWNSFKRLILTHTRHTEFYHESKKGAGKIDSKGLSRQLLEESTALTCNVELFSGYLLDRNYPCPTNYSQTKIVYQMISNFLDVIDVKFGQRELALASETIRR